MRKNTQPKPVDQLLRSWLRSAHLEDKAFTFLALSVWQEIAGDEIAACTKANKITGQTLFIDCKSSVWAHELSMLKPELLEKLSTRLGGPYIKDLRFSSRNWDPTVQEPKPNEPNQNPDFAVDEIQAAAAQTAQPAPEFVKQRVQNTIAAALQWKQEKSARGYVTCPGCGALTLVEEIPCPICRIA